MFDCKAFRIAIIEKMEYKDTYRKVAPVVGVSISTFSRAINGKELKINNVIKFCKWLNRPITDFIK